MNTLLLLPGLFSSDGGIERILRLYVRGVGELTSHPGQVLTVILNDSVVAAAQLAPYATPALAPPVTCRRSKLGCVWHTLRLARQSQRVICGHFHLLRLAHLARRFSPKLEVWLIAHGIEVWRNFSAAERRALLATHCILCVSDYTRRRIASSCDGLSEQQLVVQPNALDPQFDFSAGNSQPTQPGLILSVARLVAAESYKGVDHLITAMPAIRAAVPRARLRVVGDGDDRQRLKTLADTVVGSGLVEFTGRVSDAELHGHFSACQLFALPSRSEGFGLVYLEAFAHGKPCLAADAGGAPEVLSADTGVLANYGDVPGIASAGIAALQRTWNAAHIQARAREFSYEPFKERLRHTLAA